MKSIFTFVLIYSIPILGFCQLPFAPLGAVWGIHSECNGIDPINYDYTFTVTEDSVIQGKYCTRLMDYDWICALSDSNPIFVHDDGGKIYRYNFVTEEFQLILDYTKSLGESWRIEVCEYYFNVDSATIFVIAEEMDYKLIQVIPDSGFSFGHDFRLYEGMGGHRGHPLLFGQEQIFDTDPQCWKLTTCYEDPVEGIIYGGNSGSCFVPTEEPLHSAHTYLKVYPNPAKDYLHIQLNSPQTGNEASFCILNLLGKVMAAFQVDNFQSEFSVPVWDWATGIYFLQYLENESVLISEHFVKQ